MHDDGRDTELTHFLLHASQETSVSFRAPFQVVPVPVRNDRAYSMPPPKDGHYSQISNATKNSSQVGPSQAGKTRGDDKIQIIQEEGNEYHISRRRMSEKHLRLNFQHV